MLSARIAWSKPQTDCPSAGRGGIELTSADQLRNVGYVGKEKRLEELRDDLMRPDQQHYFPLRPVTDVVHLAEDDAEKENLSDEPKDLHDQPKNEVRLKTHLANERIAQHDCVNLEVAAHPTSQVSQISAD